MYSNLRCYLPHHFHYYVLHWNSYVRVTTVPQSLTLSLSSSRQTLLLCFSFPPCLCQSPPIKTTVFWTIFGQVLCHYKINFSSLETNLRSRFHHLSFSRATFPRIFPNILEYEKYSNLHLLSSINLYDFQQNRSQTLCYNSLFISSLILKHNDTNAFDFFAHIIRGQSFRG